MIESKEVSKENIARRAYELYTQRGGEPGKDVEDWVKRGKRAGRRAEHHTSKRKGCTFRPIQLTGHERKGRAIPPLHFPPICR